MAYDYQEMRPQVLEPEGQRLMLRMRSRAFRMIEAAGAVTDWKITQSLTGDSWLMQACLDYLVELGELSEVTSLGATSVRVFIKKNREVD